MTCRIYYQAKNFGVGRCVVAKIWCPDRHSEATDAFEELGDGMYAYDFVIPAPGRYLWLIYEEGRPSVSHVFTFESEDDDEDDESDPDPSLPGGNMSFIVEDGSGKKGATSYASVAFFRAYFADRGVDVTTMLDAEVQGLLVTATDYLDTRWGLRFLGHRYWSALYSRSVLTFTDQPSVGETVTVNGIVYTFCVSAVADTDVEIGDTMIESLDNLAEAIGDDTESDDDPVVEDFLFPDLDVASLVMFFSRDGITTTTTCVNGSFDVATSAGYSGNQQPLEFPRDHLYDRAGNCVTGVPDRVREATCEYAYKAKTLTLAPDSAVDTSVQSKSTTVGPIHTSVTYASGAILKAAKAYPAADRLLQEYVNAQGVIRG